MTDCSRSLGRAEVEVHIIVAVRGWLCQLVRGIVGGQPPTYKAARASTVIQAEVFGSGVGILLTSSLSG